MDIKELRIKRGMTQEECASYLKISRRTYQSLESNNADKTSLRYQKYCRLLMLDNDASFITNVSLKDDLIKYY